MHEFRAPLLAVFVLLSLTLAGCETVQTTQPGTVGVDRKQSMMLSSAEVDKAAVRGLHADHAEAPRRRAP